MWNTKVKLIQATATNGIWTLFIFKIIEKNIKFHSKEGIRP
jgi:hypothetical protein